MAILMLVVLLGFEIYWAYELWHDPKGAWKRATARAARAVASVRGSILEIFALGPSSASSKFENWLFWNRLGIVFFIVLTLLLLLVALFGPASL